MNKRYAEEVKNAMYLSTRPVLFILFIIFCMPIKYMAIFPLANYNYISSQVSSITCER